VRPAGDAPKRSRLPALQTHRRTRRAPQAAAQPSHFGLDIQEPRRQVAHARALGSSRAAASAAGSGCIPLVYQHRQVMDKTRARSRHKARVSRRRHTPCLVPLSICQSIDLHTSAWAALMCVCLRVRARPEVDHQRLTRIHLRSISNQALEHHRRHALDSRPLHQRIRLVVRTTAASRPPLVRTCAHMYTEIACAPHISSQISEDGIGTRYG
jgi:hypothetical protein